MENEKIEISWKNYKIVNKYGINYRKKIKGVGERGIREKV
jgi:hypothetical protein